jgi:hypothetical protein
LRAEIRSIAENGRGLMLSAGQSLEVILWALAGKGNDGEAQTEPVRASGQKSRSG